jgi:hypothetical protein
MWADDVRNIDCESHPRLCEDTSVPDHVRQQTFLGLRWGLSASIGLGEGFQIGVMLPIQLKSFTISHSLPDGSPYEIPYSLLTGPSEVEVGLGDTEVMGRFVRRVPSTPLMLGVGWGAALPTGRISPNPFDPALPASRRQQRQFGNGTFDPRFDGSLIVGTRPIGFIASASTRLPVYSNRYGYRGQRTVGASLGVVASVPAPLDTLQLLLLLDLSHSSPALWEDSPALNSGSSNVGVRMGFEWAFKPGLALRTQLLALPLQVQRGDQFDIPVALSIGLSGVIDVRPKSKRGHH